jgi:hypothetical protein
MRIRNAGIRAIVVIVGFVGASTASAAEWFSQDFMNPYDETFILDLGGILNQFDTSLRLDGTATGGRGTDINLENNGLKKNLSSFEAGAMWRLYQRHRVQLDYYSVQRSGSRTFESDISIGGNDYPIGATVGITNKYQLFAADYRYSFIQRPEYELAALVGAYGGKITFDVSAVGNAGHLTADYNKSSSTTLPLPTLGLSWDWYPTRQVQVSALAAGMKAKISDVDGRVGLFSLDGNYMLSRNFGLGLRYSYVDIRADVTKDSFNGNFRWRANSVSAYARLAF